MAEAAGIYKYIWQPNQIGITKAKELIAPLEKGLFLLTSDPDKFNKLNAPNGRIDRTNLLQFVIEYLDACKKWPEATVSVWI